MLLLPLEESVMNRDPFISAREPCLVQTNWGEIRKGDFGKWITTETGAAGTVSWKLNNYK